MAHFARLDENNVVTQVIVVDNGNVCNSEGIEIEEIGIAFCKQLFGAETNWKQTSYNHNMRKHYAGIGYTYNKELDAFISPKPFDSWILNEETADWEPPIPYPTLTESEIETHLFYHWDEKGGAWVLETPEPSAEETPAE